MPYLTFTEEEYEGLRKKDKKMAALMQIVPLYKREVDPDIFRSLVTGIIGQQISMKAYETVRGRFFDHFGEITPEKIHAASLETVQRLGISTRKALFIKNCAEKIIAGEFDPAALRHMADEDVVKTLSALDGIGPWTAEMMLIFTLERKDILSYGDLAIRRGLMYLYGHKDMPRARFEKYRKRFSPYGTLASLYLWEMSTGRYDVSPVFSPPEKTVTSSEKNTGKK